jgi:hypothetical protein
MRKQNVLSLSLQLLFPGLRKIYLGAFAVATLQSAGKTYLRESLSNLKLFVLTS